MACELVLASSFPQLQSHLLDRIQSLCKDQPFTPKWILTPTSTVAEHCKSALGNISSDIVLAGVHVRSLSQLLGQLLESLGMHVIPRYDPVSDLLLFSLVQRLPGTSELGYLRRLPSNCLALRPTFLDLADGGFGHEQTDLLRELSSATDLTGLEGAVLRLYVAWLETLEAAGLDWEPLAYQRLAKWLNDAPEGEVREILGRYTKGFPAEFFLYGFYDFTDVNTQILAALGKRVKLSLYYPYATRDGDPHAAFSFSNRVLQDLLAQFGTTFEKSTIIVDPNLPSSVTKFFFDTFLDGDCPQKPEFLTFQKASGIRAEVISAAVRIRKWLDEDGDSTSVDRIMVLAPDIELYYEEVQEIFAAFSIPVRLEDQPSRGDLESRTLLFLRKLWENHGDAEWFLALFRECPSLLIRRQIDLEAFENKIRALPVSSGESWKWLSAILSRTEQRSPLCFDQAEIDLISEIVEVWVDRTESGYPVERALELMLRISQTWLEDSNPLAPALQALERMAALIPTLVIPDRIFGSLFSLPEQHRSRSDPSDQPGVLFSSIMRARGITADAMVILGLSLGRFPARIEEDPLFSDSSRKRLRGLARDVGHRLAIKSLANDEMRLLFFLLNSSTRKIHWVIPQTDESGKNVAPTPWVQHYLHRWKETLPWRPVPRGPIEQALYLYSLDPQRGSLLPPRYANFLDVQISPGHDDASRHGRIASSAFSEKNHPDRLSVTELELLARCPYRFYAYAVAGLRPIRPLLFLIEPDVLEWGNLVHRFFERLLQPYLRRGVPLRDLPIDDSKVPWLDLDQIAENLPVRLKLLPGPLKLALARRISVTIESYLEAVKADKCCDGLPLAQEIKIRLPYPGKRYLTISGQIDRVDDRLGQCHIVDYKSGQKPWASRAERELAVKLGYQLQPLLYPWLYQKSEGLSYTPSFSFIFLGGDAPQEVLISKPEGSKRLLPSLAGLLEQGSFIPTSNELMKQWDLESATPCLYCELNSLCRRFDPRTRSHNASLFETFAQERFAYLIRQSQRGPSDVA